MAQLAHSLAKKALGAPEARDKWGKCVDEMTVMIRVEVETNPRYNSMRKL
mgnify:FL=1|tara:strand:+ start:850 stop:999 length:150 start_codon:yes stop_codon:yes gene_type:complete